MSLSTCADSAGLLSQHLQRALDLVAKVSVVHSFKEGPQYIGTHNGTFHADEVMATSMLKLLPRFGEHVILRTRDPAVLEKCDMVLDVGGKYDGSRFLDHHQAGFQKTFSDGFKTKLSSCGLIFLHFGQEILRTLYPRLAQREIQTLYPIIYKSFVEHIDGNDNGVSVGNDLRYSISTDLPHRVSNLNVRWTEEETDELLAERFRSAMAICLADFFQTTEFYATEWLQAREKLSQDLQKMAASGTPQILMLSGHYPWKSNLIALERDLKIEGQTQFAVFSDGRNCTPRRVQTIPLIDDSFEFRRPILPGCQGLRDEELSTKCGIPDCIFVHANGFIGGSKTFEGALQMALHSLQA